MLVVVSAEMVLVKMCFVLGRAVFLGKMNWFPRRGNYSLGPKKALLSFLPLFFSRTCSLALKRIFFDFFSPRQILPKKPRTEPNLLKTEVSVPCLVLIFEEPKFVR